MHVDQEFVGRRRLVRSKPVPCHEKPLAEARFRLVNAVASGCLRNFRHQRMGISVKRILQWPVAVELDPKHA